MISARHARPVTLGDLIEWTSAAIVATSLWPNVPGCHLSPQVYFGITRAQIYSLPVSSLERFLADLEKRIFDPPNKQHCF